VGAAKLGQIAAGRQPFLDRRFLLFAGMAHALVQ
jgi:hypothetical protein